MKNFGGNFAFGFRMVGSNRTPKWSDVSLGRFTYKHNFYLYIKQPRLMKNFGGNFAFGFRMLKRSKTDHPISDF